MGGTRAERKGCTERSIHFISKCTFEFWDLREKVWVLFGGKKKIIHQFILAVGGCGGEGGEAGTFGAREASPPPTHTG